MAHNLAPDQVSERLLHLALVDFHHQAANRLAEVGMKPVAGALECLASALQRLFPGATIIVGWGARGRVELVRGRGRQPPMSLAASELSEQERGLLEIEAPLSRYEPTAIGWFSEGDPGCEAVRVGLLSPALAEVDSLWLFRPQGDGHERRWQWLRTTIPELQSLFFAFAGVLQPLTSQAQRQTVADLSAGAQALLAERAIGSATWLTRAATLVKKMGQAHEPELAQHALALAVAAIEDQPRDITLPGLAPAPDLVKAGMALGVALRAFPGRAGWHLELAGLCLDMLFDSGLDTAPPRDRNAVAGDEPADALLAVLPDWFAISQQAWRAAVEPPRENQGGDFETHWGTVVGGTLPALSRYLCSAVDALDVDGFGALKLTRSWLRLWLCLEVLRWMQGGRGTSLLAAERALLRVALSCVLRDEIARECLPGSSRRNHSAARLGAALSTIVEIHAHKIVGLGHELDVRQLLSNFVDDTGLAPSGAPDSLLRHVLEVYAAGQWLLSLEVEDTRADAGAAKADHLPALAQRLAGDSRQGSGAAAAADLRRAYALASLFHDVGHFFFPRTPSTRPGLHREHSRLKLGLGTLEQAIDEAGTGAVKRCLGDLAPLHAVDEGRETELTAWLARQATDGEPDHGLLGAWYLHHLCVAARATDDTVRQAVRAVLLHNAAAVPIDAAADPLAALLVLCNELLPWEPALRRPAQRVVGGLPFSLVSAAGFSVPHAYADAHLAEVKLEAREGGGVRGVLRVAQGDGNYGAALTISLREPGSLPRPVFDVILTKAQNLGRVIPSPYLPWFPRTYLRTRPELIVQAAHLSTRDLLERLSQRSRLPLRPGLARWLSEAAPFAERAAADGTVETVKLTHVPFPLFAGDGLRRWLPALEEEALDLLRELHH